MKTFNEFLIKKQIEKDVPSSPKHTMDVSGCHIDSQTEEKMTKWHNGTRKQNIGACSDTKLKNNWICCKKLGFDKERIELEKELDKRGITMQ